MSDKSKSTLSKEEVKYLEALAIRESERESRREKINQDNQHKKNQ